MAWVTHQLTKKQGGIYRDQDIPALRLCKGCITRYIYLVFYKSGLILVIICIVVNDYLYWKTFYKSMQ